MDVILHIPKGLGMYVDTLNTLTIGFICNMELKYKMRLKEVAVNNMAAMNAFPKFLEYYGRSDLRIFPKRPRN